MISFICHACFRGEPDVPAAALPFRVAHAALAKLFLPLPAISA